MSGLSYHVASDKRKWAVVSIVLVLVIAAIVMMPLTNMFTDFNKYCLFGHTYDDNGICVKCGAEKLDEVKPDDKNEEAVAPGGAVVSVPDEGGNVEVEVRRLAASEATTVAEAANSWVITVTKVVPSSADDQTFDWNIRWKDAESEWAQGKPVTNYGTITPDSDGAKQATFRNLKAFGEQIEIVVTSRDKRELFKTVTVDYVQKITGFTFNMPDIESESTSFTYQIETSAYTIASELSFDLATKSVQSAGGFGQDTIDTAGLFLTESFRDALINTLLARLQTDLPNFPIENWYNYIFLNYYAFIDLDEASNNITFVAMYSPSGSIKARKEWPPVVRAFCGATGTLTSSYPSLLPTVFKDTVYSIQGTHATFDITYKATHNGTDYSTGTKTIEVRFDGEALHIPVEDFELSDDHLYI